MESRKKQRIALSAYFYLSGLVFSSWAARIPTIKSSLQIDEAELGSILLVMPISSFIGLPLSGWLVAKFDSRKPLVISFILHTICLYLISLSGSVFWLVLAVFFFAFFMRILNISMNTQSITLQKNYDRKINGSFHGLWSFGGISGVGITTLMVAYHIPIHQHLFGIAVFALIFLILFYPSLLKKDKAESGNKLMFGKPDPQILALGIIILFAAICEGGMFDWSGVYFKEVIKVELFTTGYLIFMTCMALFRFASDWVIHRVGMPAMYIISSSLIAVGMLLAVTMPTFEWAMFGFSLVGIGTAPVVPMTFILAGNSKKYSPGMAISIIATYAIVGMLFGPALIGYIAEVFHLRVSFIFLAVAGLMIIPCSMYYFRVSKGRWYNE